MPAGGGPSGPCHEPRVDIRARILAGPVLGNAQDPAVDSGCGPIAYPLTFEKGRRIADRSGDCPELRFCGSLLSQRLVVSRCGIERLDPPAASSASRPRCGRSRLWRASPSPSLCTRPTPCAAWRIEIPESAQIRGLRAA